jgi:hypothetical protein
MLTFVDPVEVLPTFTTRCDVTVITFESTMTEGEDRLVSLSLTL